VVTSGDRLPQALSGGQVIQLKDGVAICDLVGVKADEVSLDESSIDITTLSFLYQ